MGVGTELVVARYVALTLAVAGGEQKATEYLAALPELRQIEDRLGLSPKGMQERRWRIDEAVAEVEGPAPGVAAMADYRKLLGEAPVG